MDGIERDAVFGAGLDRGTGPRTAIDGAINGAINGVIDGDSYEAAVREGALQRSLLPAAVAVRYDGATDRVLVILDTGVELAFAPWLVQGLGGAEADDLVEAEISPSGLGLHFPRLNADVYLPGLLEGVMGTKRWMALMRQAPPLWPSATTVK